MPQGMNDTTLCHDTTYNVIQSLCIIYSTDEVVINKIKSEMDLDISPGDIDRTHRIGVPTKGINRPIIVKLGRYMDRRRVFTNKKRQKCERFSVH